MELTQKQVEVYMQEAREILHNSYSPYSNFPVGCTLLMKDGQVFHGVNVENVSFGATNCAERTAIFTAAAQGYRPHSIQAIFIAGKTEGFLPPCNICRQVLAEWADEATAVYLTREDQQIRQLSLKELIPNAFVSMDM
ncbi:cytidine deaminase [Suicoccus acidiformans]|uniref:Cytidine deaminase n=1 Tax=Suicoccus acidiformans TaxID=2036206 RepID=A0A347WLR2_9LACT|nr:cytidine deaminase [Suicoccus acidiformans]AXY26019.1 cytidine deaminase [Suicoccus acidiformans]